MRKLIITALLLSCAVLPSVAAEQTPPVKQPTTLISALKALYEKYGDKSLTSKTSRSNPETGMLEEKSEIMTIRCDKNNNLLQNAIKAFEKEKECGYQYMHITPFDRQNVAITTNSGSIIPRTSETQELWMLNVKNPDNPRLRDNYTLVLDDGKTVREGKIYLITSTRPDLQSNSKLGTTPYWDAPATIKSKKFVLEGIVDEAIADSCYNIYIANENSGIGANDLVACVPVIDKRFYFETELDEIKDGRLRAIFPGNKLCSAWIDVKFIPGFTLCLEVHNGYFDITNQMDYQHQLRLNENSNQLKVITIPPIADIPPIPTIAEETAINTFDDIKRAKELEIAIDAYQKLLDEISSRTITIRASYSGDIDGAMLKDLNKQTIEITKKMKKLIDEYAKTIGK